MKIRKASLGQLTLLGRGGFSQVFRADRFHLQGDSTALAYKEFTVAQAEQALSATAAVSFRQKLSQEDCTELDRFFAWPKAVVEDSNDGVCGLLMPLIPEEFFGGQLDPDTGRITLRPREMSWLIASAEQREAAQVDLPEIDRTDRLILLAQLVYAIRRLHEHAWVFGDLSFKNAVFALDPPRLMLIDCDGAAALADRNRKQPSTPFWDPPECQITPPHGQRSQQVLQDTITDTYKLGLAILRCLTPGEGASSSRAIGRLVGELDTEGTDLVARALAVDRESRPTAKELHSYLERLVSQHAAAPIVILAKLATPFRSRSQDVRIEWRIDNATTIEVSVGGSYRTEIDPVYYPNGVGFRTDSAGPVSIRVRNRFGSVSTDLGELTFFERSPLEASVSSLEVSAECLPSSQINAIEEYSPALLAATKLPDIGALGAGMPIIQLDTIE
jgi:serine/threonine protein kinase